MQSKLKRQKLIVTSMVLFLAFNYPIVSIANRTKLIGNIPLLYLYILLVWAAGIFVMYQVADRKSKKPDE